MWAVGRYCGWSLDAFQVNFPLLEINRRSCRQLINSSCACIRQVEGGIGFTSLRCAKVTFQDVSGLSTLGLRRSLRNLGRIKLKDCLPPSSPRILSSPLLSKNINIKIYRNTILPVVLCGCETCSVTFFLSFLYRASFQHMEWKSTDVTILFVYCWISTCFGPTGPSSGELVQLFTQPLVQFLCRSVRVLCMLWPVLVTILY